MPNTIDFKTLPDKAQNCLNKLSALVSGVIPLEIKTWRFNTRTLKPDSKIPDIINKVADWADKKNIYIYTLRIATKNCDTATFSKAFAEARKAEKNNRKYARCNNSNSKCLYVGSSLNLSNRLKEHLGYGAAGTYALHLAYWANPFNLEIEFQCAKYPTGFASDVYQILEDTLWKEMAPMFGRKGAK